MANAAGSRFKIESANRTHRLPIQNPMRNAEGLSRVFAPSKDLRAVATWRILGVVPHDLRGWALLVSGVGLGVGCAWVAPELGLGSRLALAGASSAAFVGLALVLGGDAVDRDILRGVVARLRPMVAGRAS